MKTTTAKVQKSGRITIPKAVREQMHWTEGSVVDFTARPDGRVEVRSQSAHDHKVVMITPMRQTV